MVGSTPLPAEYGCPVIVWLQGKDDLTRSILHWYQIPICLSPPAEVPSMLYCEEPVCDPSRILMTLELIDGYHGLVR